MGAGGDQCPVDQIPEGDQFGEDLAGELRIRVTEFVTERRENRDPLRRPVARGQHVSELQAGPDAQGCVTGSAEPGRQILGRVPDSGLDLGDPEVDQQRRSCVVTKRLLERPTEIADGQLGRALRRCNRCRQAEHAGRARLAGRAAQQVDRDLGRWRPGVREQRRGAGVQLLTRTGGEIQVERVADDRMREADGSTVGDEQPKVRQPVCQLPGSRRRDPGQGRHVAQRPAVPEDGDRVRELDRPSRRSRQAHQDRTEHALRSEPAQLGRPLGRRYVLAA